MKRESTAWLMGLFLASTMPLAFAVAEELLRLEVTEHTDAHHEFTGTAKSYGVTITNLTNRAVTIERGIRIEKKTSSGWSIQIAGMQAVGNCGDFDYRYNWKAPVRLKAHSSLAVVPWDGMLCGGQCMATCAKNYNLGPGIYRFVVVTSPDGKKIASPPFTMS